MCDEAGIFNCTSLAIGFIYVWLCSPQASNNNNNNNKKKKKNMENWRYFGSQ